MVDDMYGLNGRNEEKEMRERYNAMVNVLSDILNCGRWDIEDLFDSENKGRIYVRDFNSNWILDLNILKHYDMYVNFQKAGVGLRTNNCFKTIKEKSNSLKVLITIFILLSNAFGLGLLGFYLFINGNCFRLMKIGDTLF